MKHLIPKSFKFNFNYMNQTQNFVSGVKNIVRDARIFDRKYLYKITSVIEAVNNLILYEKISYKYRNLFGIAKNIVEQEFYMTFILKKNKNLKVISQINSTKHSIPLSFNNCDSKILNRTTTIVIKNSLISIPKRNMMKYACNTVCRFPYKNTSKYSTERVVKLKPKSNASKDLAADNSAIHRHHVENVCNKQECEKKKCVILCGDLKTTNTKGFFTHRPIAGKFCRFINDKDAKDKEDSQYYVKNPDKAKQADINKITSYKKSDIKEDSDFYTYMIKNSDKFND